MPTEPKTFIVIPVAQETRVRAQSPEQAMEVLGLKPLTSGGGGELPHGLTRVSTEEGQYLVLEVKE